MSNNKIQIMDTQLSNMIAAGEVVERPASAVKELVENSVDAGATKIEIHLQDSGVRQIKVIDNGSGMSADDAKLAFLRHATSKVKSTHDIMRISTLGFRGEALPSIAAVSDVHLKTSDGKQTGYFVHIKGGEIITEEPFAIRKGTEIEVNHLFFNTPARLKHLKSLNTELSHITEYMTKTALAHPGIAITLTNNNREVFKTPGNTDLQTVIARIYGFDIAKKMHSFSCGNDDFKINGLISAPDITRASRNYITLNVNNRPIKNYELVRVIIEAYHTFLPKDRFPLVVVNINLDPLLVDVNVHPAKIEVRFSKEEALKSFIVTEITKTLKSITAIPTVNLPKKAPLMPISSYRQPSLMSNNTNKQSLANYRGNGNESSDYLEIRQPAEPSYDVYSEVERMQNIGVLPVAKPVPASPNHSQTREETVNVDFDQHFAKAQLGQMREPKEEKDVLVAIPDTTKTSLELYYIGQLHGTYLLAQNDEGLFLIDQHAAMERVLYEKNYPLLGNATTDSMELLVPITLSYPVADLIKVKDELPRLAELGFEIEEFGSTDLIIRTTPVWANRDAQVIVETMLQVLISGRNVDIGKLREAVAVMMSCKQSIKANQYLSEAEVKGLLADLCRCEQPYTCPHGRPIIVKMTKYEIERLFKRA